MPSPTVPTELLDELENKFNLKTIQADMNREEFDLAHSVIAYKEIRGLLLTDADVAIINSNWTCQYPLRGKHCLWDTERHLHIIVIHRR